MKNERIEISKQEKEHAKQVIIGALSGFNFCTVEELQKAVSYRLERNIPQFYIRGLIKQLKIELAHKGLLIVNKTKHGYRFGSESEFRGEIYKSLIRSFAHAKSCFNLLETLKESDKEFALNLNCLTNSFEPIFAQIDRAIMENGLEKSISVGEAEIKEAGIIPEDLTP